MPPPTISQGITPISAVPLRSAQPNDALFRAQVETFLVAVAGLTAELAAMTPQANQLEANVNAKEESATNAATAAATALQSIQNVLATLPNGTIDNSKTTDTNVWSATKVAASFSAANHAHASSAITDIDSKDFQYSASRMIVGGGTITVSATGACLWSSRFVVTSEGFGSHASTDGYFDITCPVSGTITGVGGASNKTATAAGIPLAAGEALFYILPIGSAHSSVAANFRVVGNSSAVVIPSSWVKLAKRNIDSAYVEFTTGISLRLNTSINTDLYDVLASDIQNLKTVGGSSLAGSGDIPIAPTTTQVLSAVAGASLGAVGTHAFLCQTSLNTTAISAGGTYAGSVLRYSGFFGSAMTTASTIAGDLSAGSSPAGTWMALGSATYTSANESRATLFLRIA